MGTSIDLGAFSDSRYAQLLREGCWKLRFPSDLERQFDEFHLLHIRARVRVFFILWPLLELYRVVDGLRNDIPDTISLWTVPTWLFIAAGAWILWSRWYWRLYLPGTAVLAAILLSITSYSLPIDYPGNDEVQSLKLALNVPLVTHLLLGLPFYRALAVNLLCGTVYVISVVQVDPPAAELISCASAALIVTAVAAALAYSAERSSRKNFLQERLLGEIATRDGMTGLQNRAAFDAHLERLWKQAQRTQESIGLLLLDVDHFKGFNDTQGHQAGDACLRQIASILKSHARRPLDLAARYGGEEFAIILFATPADQIRAIAEAIRLTVETAGILNPAAPRKIVTISCGMAVVTPAAGRSVHGLVQFADEALYEAKENGRNCVHRANQDYSTLETGIFRRHSHLRAVS